MCARCCCDSIQLTFINCWLKPKLLRGLSEPILGTDQDKRARRGSDSKLVDHQSDPPAEVAHGSIGTDELPEQGRMDTHVSLRDKSSNVAKIHAAAEVYPAQTEHVFNYLQVFTACVGAFGHGANDVSNAVAPFATIFGLYVSGVVEAEEPVQTWVLAFGGLGIVIGLVRRVHHANAGMPCGPSCKSCGLSRYLLRIVSWQGCLGYKVIKSIGVDMIKVRWPTPISVPCVTHDRVGDLS
eukprot:COSAG02_NODE_6675_length_3424_cov_16.009624_4_plen_239_part_00